MTAESPRSSSRETFGLRSVLGPLLAPVRRSWNRLRLPAAAREERRRDRAGVPKADPGAARVVEAGLAWLGRAQDRSSTGDGGVARHYSLITGWGSSYPETTGYIVPTLLEQARTRGDETLRARARRMADWLVSIQLPGGGFQGGAVDSRPVVPVTFNTGQILFGLAAATREFGEAYRPAMRAAADWLVQTQDADGCWRKHSSPFTSAGEKVYETHVAWALLEAARIEPSRGYAEAGLANVRWALKSQRRNGWLAHCCLVDPQRPLTHTLGYALRGLVEAYLFSRDAELLAACRRTADGLLSALGADGRLAGRLDQNWRAAVSWVCLTGSVQIAHSWLVLYRETGERRYLDAARAANRFVRRTIRMEGPDDVRGAVKASFPVSGGYCPYQYLNWAVKFCIDSNALELEIGAQ